MQEQFNNNKVRDKTNTSKALNRSALELKCNYCIEMFISNVTSVDRDAMVYDETYIPISS